MMHQQSPEAQCIRELLGNYNDSNVDFAVKKKDKKHEHFAHIAECMRSSVYEL